MRGHKGFHNVAENVSATRALLDTNRKYNRLPQLCWKCQKESRFEEGAHLRIMTGLKQYICKKCMDAKREAQAQKEQDQNQNT
jgi:hypothetical protein